LFQPDHVASQPDLVENIAKTIFNFSIEEDSQVREVALSQVYGIKTICLCGWFTAELCFTCNSLWPLRFNSKAFDFFLVFFLGFS